MSLFLNTHPHSQNISLERISNGIRTPEEDILAIEEPLEIRLDFELAGRRAQKSISITMRTPGEDFELAAGFLFTEGIVRSQADIASIQYCKSPDSDEHSPNIVRVELQPGVVFDAVKLQRNFYTTSSCGVCGKASLDAIRQQGCPELSTIGPRIQPTLVHDLPGQLRAAQHTFDLTGGLHACGLFTPDGELTSVFEDVGRHNALDKLIGNAILNQVDWLASSLLVLSGRISFELVQKALMAGIPLIAAVGAPSTLAVELAREHNMTLLGFVRDERFNIYNAPWRIL